MTSALPGTSTLGCKVFRVSPNGFSLLLGDEELFVPFADFPWFLGAGVAQLSDVQRPSPGHLYWPQLDIDLAVDSIRNPDKFPLVSRADV
jgi:hypothetical protein